MKDFTEDEKEFRQELRNLLEKWGAVIDIEDTIIEDYTNIPNFGTIFKKTIQVTIGGERGYGKHGLTWQQFDLGQTIDKDTPIIPLTLI